MQRSSHVAKAIAWMMGALLSFAIMAISVRELSAEMHAFQMLFVRSVIGVAILSVVLSFRGWGTLKTGRIGGHLLRNIVHFGGQVFWILGISLLPLATVSAIEFTTPVWGAILAVIFLGERMNRGRWLAFLLGIAGVLVILRPGFAAIHSGAFIMLACTFFFGATNTITKWLTRTEQPLAILFYMVLMQSLLGVFTASLVWVPIQVEHWPWLLLLALTGLSAHYSLVRAFAAADIILVMPFEFLKLPLVAFAGFLLYGEGFDPIVLLGAALIFSGNYASLRHESRAPVARAPAAP